MHRWRPCRGLRRTLFAVLAALAVLSGTPPAAASAPNFVIILGDDVGRNDLGPYGHPHIRTPNLDRLAASGFRFDRAFLSISSCSPARCSILTGRYPHSAGATDAHHHLQKDQVSVVETLRAAGYYTESVGKWHLGPDASTRFDRVVRDNGPSGADHWIDELKNRPRDRPFFFWLASNDAHRPYERIPEYPHYRYNDVLVPPFLPDIQETRMDFGMYYEEITRLDDYVGRVLNELDRQKVTGNTLVLFLSDDGRPFPRCKTTLYDSGINTPFIVKFPSLARAGGRSTSLVSVIDVAPTLLDLAGVKVPATMQGRSFTPILRDPAASIRDRIFAEQNWHDYTALKRAVRTERYTYIRNFYSDLPNTPPVDAVRTITYQAMRRLNDQHRLTPDQRNCFIRPRPEEELYDTQADPDELVNLAGRPEHASTLAALRRSLETWRRETADREPSQRRPDEYDRETGAPLPGTAHPHETEGQ
jgi:N-sulfoglucosamine sulfohydrolase